MSTPERPVYEPRATPGSHTPGVGSPLGRQTVVTPEAVALTFEVAGLGSRFIALAIDTAIQFLALFLILAVVAGIGDGVGASSGLVLAIVLSFVVFWGYFPLLEGLWDGRTVGKRAQRIRVVQVDGRPVTWGPVLLRNLVRIVDFLPGMYAVGTITMLVNRRDQRLGDLAAGTIVVREERGLAVSMPPPTPPAMPWEAAAEGFDPRAVGDRQYELVRSFLQRRWGLTPDARAALARQLADALRPRLGPAAARYDDEPLLEAVARAYRARFTSEGGAPPRPLEGPGPPADRPGF